MKKFSKFLILKFIFSVLAAEAAKRLKIMEIDAKEKLVPKLRIESRRKYLEKRKEDKVAELEADIVDDEYLFDEEV